MVDFFHPSLSAASAAARKRELVAQLRGVDILLLRDDHSPEREISAKACSHVSDCLSRLGLAARIGDDQDLVRAVAGETIVFNLMYGARGEGGYVSAYCEYRGLGFAYSDSEACPIALDKWRTKLLLAAHGLPVAPSHCVFPQTFEQDLQAARELRFPIVCKPISQGSSVGLFFCENASALSEQLPRLVGEFGAYLLEPYLPGSEFTVGVLKDSRGSFRAFQPILLGSRGAVADLASKYQADAMELVCPAPVDGAERARLGEMALAACAIVGCDPVARVDMRCTEAGAPLILEINHFPGMTPTSWLPRAAAVSGWDFDLIVLEIAAAAATRSKPGKRYSILVPPRETSVALALASMRSDTASYRAAQHVGAHARDASIASVASLISEPMARSVIEFLYETEVDNTSVRGALDYTGASRAGASLLCTTLCCDKLRQRQIISSLGIPQPRFAVASSPDFAVSEHAHVVVKARRSTQSAGVELMSASAWQARRNAFPEQLAPEQFVVEEYCPGCEVHIGIVTHADGRLEILAPFVIEDRDHPWLFDAATKASLWDVGRCPGVVPADVLSVIEHLSLAVHRALDAPSLARVEWRVGASGPRLIEYDHSPGLTPASILTRMIEQTNVEVGSYVQNLKRNARAPFGESLL